MSQVSLRVAEAQSRDVGRGIARIDPKIRLWQYIGLDIRKTMVKASFA